MSLLCICDFLFMILYDGLCECAWKVTMKHEKLVTTIWPAILGAVSHFFYSSRFLLILHWAVLSWLPFNSQVHHWVLYMTGSVLHNTWFHQDIASVYIQETSNKSPKKWGHQSSGAGMSRKVIVAERLLCDGWYKREVPFWGNQTPWWVGKVWGQVAFHLAL